VALSEKAPHFVRGLVAIFSIALWISIVFAGLFYAFT
jgi:hypothetical protein